MLLQAITIDDRAFEVEKASRSFIKEHIFPAGCLPSLEVIARSMRRSSPLRMVDLEDITDGYPETLARWRERFTAAARAGARRLATTAASAVSGSCTCAGARAASASGASTTCRSCSPGRAPRLEPRSAPPSDGSAPNRPARGRPVALLNLIRAGQGEPLLLVHPLGGELVTWEPVFERLAAERDAIAVDMPGFGASPPLPADVEPTPQALAAALAAQLDELGIERAHVAGNSLGGWVALELAKLGRALSVTCLGAAGLWSLPLGPRQLEPRRSRARRLGRALVPLLPLLTRSVHARRLLLASTVGHPERVPPAAAARLVRAYVTAPAFEGANAAMRAAVFSGIDQVDVPVTLAWGELDRLVGPPRGGVPGTRGVLLPGCGHVPTWDDPALVSKVLLEASVPVREQWPA